MTQSGTRVDKRVQRGEETKRAILGRAMDIASEEGLDGLSIGRLATDLDVSKSGVFVHFGSMEELQLATIRAARRIFADHVTRPALDTPPGLERLWRLSEAFFTYSAKRVFSGGCFFNAVTTEYDTRPGRIHDAVADVMQEWHTFRERLVADAQQLGELRADIDARLVAFQLSAAESAAETQALLFDDESRYDIGRKVVKEILRAAAADPAAVDALT